MAHFTATIDCTVSCEAAFTYMADFSNAALWDPTVTRVTRESAGEVGLGTRFKVFLGMGPAEVSLKYETKRFEPNQCLVFEANTPLLRSLDTIQLEAYRQGCRLHYDADVRLRGAASLFDLPTHLAFQVSGRRSLAGLKAALAEIA